MAGDEKKSPDGENIGGSAGRSPGAGSADQSAAAAYRGSEMPSQGSESLKNYGDNSETIEDELPEDEPLTPELVEEEAIRGDFMLRWAAVFLAVLFGFSQLNDTRTLVSIRSGDQMRAGGFLPSRVDTMSFSAEGVPYVNVSWLFDHLVSGLWSSGQGLGLTAFKALSAGLIAYVLVNISLAGIPTWWTAICAVFAVVACAGDFLPQTDLITLIGMVLVVRYLHQHREGTGRGLAWKLPLLTVVWCNLDSRAWIGAFTVVLYSLGTMWAASRRPQDEQPAESNAEPMPSAPVVPAVLSVLALLINPFPLNSLLSPLALYSVEYPTMQQLKPLRSQMAAASFDGRVDNYSMLHPDAFMSFDHTQISGIAILLIAFVTLGLSRDRRNMGFMVALAGLTVLAVLKTHELPAAVILAAAVASTTAQRWYRSNYSLQYSIDPRELFFSRAGRAVTVAAMAFLGFCVVAGRLPGNTPVGIGFDKDTWTTINTVGTQLKDIPADARILHTRLDQGDILIWHGRKSIIDSRMMPFGRLSDPNSVVARHKMILENVLLPRPQPAEEEEERKKQEQIRSDAFSHLSNLKISHIMVRLSPPGSPDYRSVQVISGTPGWILTSLGPSAAFLENVGTETAPEKLGEKFPPFGRLAFTDANPVEAVRGEFAREPDFYQTFIYRRRPMIDEQLRLAEHYLFLSAGEARSPQEASLKLSLTTLAIRALNSSLAGDTQNSSAYRMLGTAYHQLGILESVLSGADDQSGFLEVRDLQSIVALRQSQKAAPDDLAVLELLMQKFISRNNFDHAHDCASKLLSGLKAQNKTAETTEVLKNLTTMSTELSTRIQSQEESLQKFLQTEVPETDQHKRAIQITRTASELMRGGFHLRALNLLQQHSDLTSRLPDGQVLIGLLLLENGDIEQGYRMLNQLAAVAQEQSDSYAELQWHLPAAVSQLAVADYEAAIETWTSKLKSFERVAEMQAASGIPLISMPAAAQNVLSPAAELPAWPVRHLNDLKFQMQLIPASRADMRLMIALCHIEYGNMQSARLILQSIITECGESPGRNLAVLYYSMIDRNPLELLQQSNQSLWEEFEFMPASPAADETKQPASAEPATGDAAAASPEDAPAATTPPTETAPPAEIEK